jgi:hypothetical protein
MPLASANGIEIFYDDVGDPNAPALLLIMGLGTQMIAGLKPFAAGWPTAAFASSASIIATSA